jgi:chromosome segregation ATPase
LQRKSIPSRRRCRWRRQSKRATPNGALVGTQKAEELGQQLGHARRRAKIAERELAKLSADVETKAHAAQSRERELRVQLEQAQQTNEVLKHEVERVERERRALQLNLRDVLGNLRHAAQEAGGSRGAADQATLVPERPADSGW